MSRPLRYTFILALVALGTVLAAVSGWRYARASAPVNGPIILLSIDALRADRLPAYGYQNGSTAAIDALAKDGIVFERAFSHVPQTLPAHAALLTGRLPFENGVRDSVGFSVNSNERSLAEMLGQRGYATAGVVSSFLLRKKTGLDQGFTVFDDTPSTDTDEEPELIRDSDEAERVAEHWFDSTGTTRAFLFLHIADPADGSGETQTTTYDARVTKADQSVGRLVRYLKEHQLYDQSTIILVSDHGQGLGEHGENGHGLLLNGGVLHTPLIVKQAAGADAGRRVTTPVQHIDVVPTILDLAKAPIPGNLRGRSLVPLFSDGSFDERMIYAESLFGRYHFGWDALTALTDGHFLYTDGTTPQLFDLEADPESTNNLADSRPELVTKFQKALADFSGTSSIPPMGSVSPADRTRFEQLGYVGTPARPTGTLAGTDTEIDVDVAIVEQYRLAARLQASGPLSAAIDAYRTLATMAPASADAWQHLAAVAARGEKFDVAVDASRHVIELTPAGADGYLDAANALIRLRRFEDARASAQQILDNGIGGPRDLGIAHEVLARIALARRNYELARAEARLAEDIAPERPVTAYVEGRIALDQRRFEEALESFESAMKTLEEREQEPFGDLRIYTAEALIRAERLPDAEQLLLEQLKDTPLNARATAGLAAIKKAAGRTTSSAAVAQH